MLFKDKNVSFKVSAGAIKLIWSAMENIGFSLEHMTGQTLFCLGWIWKGSISAREKNSENSIDMQRISCPLIHHCTATVGAF